MSSAVQSSLMAIQQQNYLCMILLVVIGYDYILLLPKEVEYIWSKPWTWVSTLFVLVRYCGLFTFAVSALVGSSFMPGPSKVCEILHDVESFTYILFLGAADLVMILRVWAMYNRSRRILGVLLILFSVEIISVVVANVFYSDPKKEPQIVIQVLEYSFCEEPFTSPIFAEVTDSLQITFATVLCTLAIIQFARQLVQMYRVTKQWQLNRYMNLLVSQGILYFIAIFLTNFVDLLGDMNKIPSTNWEFVVAYTVGIVPVVTLSPRFIISIRELHAKDVRGRRGSGIDSGFGLSSLSNQGATGGMVFAVGAQDEADDEQDERTGNMETGGSENQVREGI